MLTYNIYSFTCPKEGNTENENEDSFRVPSQNSDTRIRVAVADGATESSFSKEWADLLICYYDCFEDFSTSFINRIFQSVRKSWLERISLHDLPWYAQQKLEYGAFSTLLGVDIDLESKKCNAIAVGDSNFFVFRDNEMLNAFPIIKSEEFNNRPFLLSTEVHKNKADGHLFHEQSIDLVSDDVLILSTDAISLWIMKQVEIGGKPHEVLYQLLAVENYKDQFEKWVEVQRKMGTIKNDDTTLILIKLKDGIT